MESKEEIELMGKLRIIKNKIEKSLSSFACLLWIISTLWDIYKLQRYWFDYAVELYTSYILILILIYLLYPKVISFNTYKSFKIITKIKGRGFLFIIISFLFLKDKFLFHKFCAIILLISGISCFICEILIPTTKEEISEISKFFENKSKLSDIVEINQKLEDKNFRKINIHSNKINVNDIEDNNFIDIDKRSDEGIILAEEKIKNSSNSSNPYDLPDF